MDLISDLARREPSSNFENMSAVSSILEYLTECWGINDFFFIKSPLGYDKWCMRRITYPSLELDQGGYLKIYKGFLERGKLLCWVVTRCWIFHVQWANVYTNLVKFYLFELSYGPDIEAWTQNWHHWARLLHVHNHVSVFVVPEYLLGCVLMYTNVYFSEQVTLGCFLPHWMQGCLKRHLGKKG